MRIIFNDIQIQVLILITQRSLSMGLVSCDVVVVFNSKDYQFFAFQKIPSDVGGAAVYSALKTKFLIRSLSLRLLRLFQIG